MQTKEKQGFQLKVHLFFNMKTLIELVGSPCSSGQQSPLATDRTTSGDSGAGFYSKKLPYTSHEQREMDVGEEEGLSGRSTKGEKKRTSLVRVKMEQPEACVSSLHLLPFFLKTGNSSPPWIGVEFTSVSNAYGFSFTCVKHHLSLSLLLRVWFPTASTCFCCVETLIALEQRVQFILHRWKVVSQPQS